MRSLLQFNLKYEAKNKIVIRNSLKFFFYLQISSYLKKVNSMSNFIVNMIFCGTRGLKP